MEIPEFPYETVWEACILDPFSRFDTIGPYRLVRDRQADGHKHDDGIYRSGIALRGIGRKCQITFSMITALEYIHNFRWFSACFLSVKMRQSPFSNPHKGVYM